jgi:hypothetical protein
VYSLGPNEALESFRGENPKVSADRRGKNCTSCRLPTFLTGDAIDRRSYPVGNDNRAFCVLQNRLIFFVQLLAGLKVEASRASRRQLTCPLLL